MNKIGQLIPFNYLIAFQLLISPQHVIDESTVQY